MLIAIKNKLCKLKRHLETINFNSKYFTISRVLLASGTLSTLIFNNSEFLFYPNKQTFSLGKTVLMENINLFKLFPPEYIVYAKIISIIILFLVIIGIYPRYTCILHWWVSFSFFGSSSIIDGGDQITAIITLLLILIYLFDNRKWHWTERLPNNNNKSVYISSLALIAIKFQMCFLYLQASLSKLGVEEWKNGTCLYYWFKRPDFGNPEYFSIIFDPILKNTVLLPLLTWSVFIFEFLLFLAITFKQPTKNKILIFGILFHFAIFMIHGLFSFSIAMTAGLLLYLGPTQLNVTNVNKINNDEQFNQCLRS